MYPARSVLPVVSTLLLAMSPLNVDAAAYNGPVARLWTETPGTLSSAFARGNAAWITPSAAPSNWVALTRAGSQVAAAMKGADFGGGAFEYVSLLTSPAAGGMESMDSLNIQDTRFDTPPDQVQSLTVWNVDGADLVTMTMGGSATSLRVLDASMTDSAAASLIGRHDIELVTGTVYIYNTTTNSFQPLNDAVLQITVD